jgi:predicted Zn-dependent peptidase
MIEYTIREEDGLALWACFTNGDNYHEVNILGMALSEIQPTLKQAQDDFAAEIEEMKRLENNGE